MKVVLFCGGLGTRLREFSDTIPKPLVEIGYRPIIWHLMKYYAHFGHDEFILALGYRGDLIKDFFLKYDECLSNDFTFSNGGKEIALQNQDIASWKIHFVETGMHANIGERLTALRPYIADEEMFLANYSDGLCDAPLDDQINMLRESNAVASFMAVRPSQSFHTARVGEDGLVQSIEHVGTSDVWINGGFMVLRQEIFDYMREGEELVERPFARLLEQRRLHAYKYQGFWKAMDTFKDKITFDRMYARGDWPWDMARKAG